MVHGVDVRVRLDGKLVREALAVLAHVDHAWIEARSNTEVGHGNAFGLVAISTRHGIHVMEAGAHLLCHEDAITRVSGIAYAIDGAALDAVVQHVLIEGEAAKRHYDATLALDADLLAVLLCTDTDYLTLGVLDEMRGGSVVQNLYATIIGGSGKTIEELASCILALIGGNAVLIDLIGTLEGGETGSTVLGELLVRRISPR